MSRVLILGSGGREHAIAEFIAKDEKVDKIFCAPGNPGTDKVAENISIDLNNNDQILDLIKNKNIDFTIVGPEGPLENGIVDFVESNGYKIFGPSKYAAQLETSKLFANDGFQLSSSQPTVGDDEYFLTVKEANDYLTNECPFHSV